MDSVRDKTGLALLGDGKGNLRQRPPYEDWVWIRPQWGDPRSSILSAFLPSMSVSRIGSTDDCYMPPEGTLIVVLPYRLADLKADLASLPTRHGM